MPQTYKTKKEIEAWLQEHKIVDYYIETDLSVIAQNNVDLSACGLNFIPVKFKHAVGDFNISNNYLTSLENCPQSVGGDFLAQNNRLTSLKGAPKIVAANFNVASNQLKTLEGSPKSVGKNYFCGNNQLETLEFAPENINGIFSAFYNRLKTLKHGPKVAKVLFTVSNNPLESLEFAPETAQHIDAIETGLKTLLHFSTSNLNKIHLTLTTEIEPYLPPSMREAAKHNNKHIELNKQELQLAQEKEYLSINLKIMDNGSKKIYKI